VIYSNGGEHIGFAIDDKVGKLLGTPQQRGQAASQCRRQLPNEEAIIRLIGAVLLKANDDWQLQHR
jgi:hypothetical protein